MGYGKGCPPLRPIRILGSVVSSLSTVNEVRGGARIKTILVWLSVSPDYSILYIFWLRSVQCLGEYHYKGM